MQWQRIKRILPRSFPAKFKVSCLDWVSSNFNFTEPKKINANSATPLSWRWCLNELSNKRNKLGQAQVKLEVIVEVVV